MRISIELIITVWCALSTSECFASFAKVGSSGLQSLDIPSNINQAAFSGGGIAYIHGIDALFSNPAATAHLKGLSLYADEVELPLDIYRTNFSVGYQIGNSIFSVGYLFLDYGVFDEATELAPDLTSTFTASDSRMTVGYATRISDVFTIGLSLSYLYLNYSDYKANGWAFDFGTIYQTEFAGMTLAMVLRNFGPDMQFEGTFGTISDGQVIPGSEATEFRDFPLPLTFQLGAMLPLWGYEDAVFNSLPGKMNLIIDLIHPNDNLEQFTTGLSYIPFDFIEFMGGYCQGTDAGGLSGGVGINVGKRIRFSYALSDLGRIDNTIHYFGFRYQKD